MRTKILVIALVVVGLASVAYAAFSQTLNIGGTGTANGDWDVKITNIVQTSATGATDASIRVFHVHIMVPFVVHFTRV